MQGYIPKSWRVVAGRLEPVSQPASKLEVVLPQTIADAKVHDETIVTVGGVVAALNGRTQFTLADVADAAGLDRSFFNTPRGSVEFRAVMKKLLVSGRIVAGVKGRSGGEIAAQVEAIADELDGLDF